MQFWVYCTGFSGFRTADGLVLGCRPFLLQANASYTQIGIFSLASYPYSFKLFWSPIVDSVYSLAFGRRKSWIVSLRLDPTRDGKSVLVMKVYW